MSKLKLTPKLALDIGFELWTWLAANPLKHKVDWPGWDEYSEMRSNCPCCEYVVHEYGEGVDCNGICIVEWPNGSCSYASSPYRRWCQACTACDEDAAREAAEDVAELFRDALTQLNEDDKDV